MTIDMKQGSIDVMDCKEIRIEPCKGDERQYCDIILVTNEGFISIACYSVKGEILPIIQEI